MQEDCTQHVNKEGNAVKMKNKNTSDVCSTSTEVQNTLQIYIDFFKNYKMLFKFHELNF